jgi:lysophospholipase L1-like esterase
MKPFRNLIFVLTVFVLLLLIALLFPREGISLGKDLTLRFFDPAAMLASDSAGNAFADSLVHTVAVTDDPEYDATDSLFALSSADTALPGVDSLTIARRDSVIRARIDSIAGSVLPLEVSEQGRMRLDYFFERAKVAKSAPAPLRVLHYGDSQIENDRMSALIRYRLQKVFGGSGCGMVPAVPLYSGNPVFKETQQGDWIRYTGFGRRDTALTHNSFGAMVCFTSIPQVSEEWPALEFKFLPGRRASRFETIRLFLHAYSDSGTIAWHLNDTLSDTLVNIPGGYQQIVLEDIDEAATVKLEFDFPAGGRMYGLAFDPSSGIQLDNMAMRASSGLEFSKIDRPLLEQMFVDMDPGLIILQFGGNVVPYIRNVAHYQRVFKRELALLQEIIPEVAVIVIGPADMSTKENGKFTTFATIEPVRDALRKAALESGYAFWDMYEAMGGHNSMPNFVLADPPLAHPDYVHLTPRGANFMAEMFVKALLKEYAGQ